jgi:hypothetical protein
MSQPLGTFSDDFYVNLNLNTEMALPSNRETVLHFFEQMQRHFPTMKNFYHRDGNEYVLEEKKDGGRYRWVSLEGRRLCAGYVSPPDLAEAMQLHLTIAELLPYALSVSPLDCDTLNLMFGFDFSYRGNHNKLVAEALGMIPAFEQMNDSSDKIPICYEPSIQFALDPSCKTQCRLSIETRTTAYQIRSGEFSEEQISVYLTLRRYGSLNVGETYAEVLKQLAIQCEEITSDYVIQHVLLPLQQTIALK